MQYDFVEVEIRTWSSHNPYFSRRFFAIGTMDLQEGGLVCHNPYFSRRFFAIYIARSYVYKGEFSHNPYFSRRFFAILFYDILGGSIERHNPYFSRRFFAIMDQEFKKLLSEEGSQSLF